MKNPNQLSLRDQLTIIDAFLAARDAANDGGETPLFKKRVSDLERWRAAALVAQRRLRELKGRKLRRTA